MPVKKPSPKKTPPAPKGHDCCFAGECSTPFVKQVSLQEFGHKLLWTLVGIMLAYGIVYLGTLIRNNLQEYNYIGQADRLERTITIDGVGTAEMTPNIAQVTLGATVEGETVEEAQNENSEKMNGLIAELKAMGIADADIQTQNYNVYPRYDYTQEEGRELIGYEVSQNVMVKIRDTEQTGDVLALAGTYGLNSVGGVNFQTDDTDVYKSQARQEAIADAFSKAKALSSQLGVQVVSIVSYNEYDFGGFEPYRSSAYLFEDEFGYGGAPDIEPGSEEVTVNVSVTFEIR